MLPSKRWPLRYVYCVSIINHKLPQSICWDLMWPGLKTVDVSAIAGVRLQPQAAGANQQNLRDFKKPQGQQQMRLALVLTQHIFGPTMLINDVICCKLLDKLPRGSYDNSIVRAAA
eukprot:scaffold122798_cov18-Prasinocladus_malaysianus.AAC.1